MGRGVIPSFFVIEYWGYNIKYWGGFLWEAACFRRLSDVFEDLVLIFAPVMRAQSSMMRVSEFGLELPGDEYAGDGLATVKYGVAVT